MASPSLSFPPYKQQDTIQKEVATKAPVSDVLLVPATTDEGKDSEPTAQLTVTTQRNRVGI